MRHISKNSSWIVITVFILTLAASSFGQKKPFPTNQIDQPSFPFDFTDKFYHVHGVDFTALLNRRNGDDGLSVVWTPNNSNQNNVRILVTLPAYDHYGQMMFWSPLAEMTDQAFLDSKVGFEAKQMAQQFPVFVFPARQIKEYSGFSDARQAPMIDVTQAPPSNSRVNPLGLREIWMVHFTEKAFTGEGADLMAYMLKKNGIATDDTPILKTLSDVRMMQKEGLVVTEAFGYFPFAEYKGQYAVAPMIADPRFGAIAADAFLWLPMKDGQPLPAEMPFMEQFNCLQKTGNWCIEK